MKILLLSVSKKNISFKDSIDEYRLRLSKFVEIEEEALSHSDIKTESENLIKRIRPDDYVVLMDEHGSNLKSEQFAELLDNRMQDSQKRIVFIIGGAYGVTEYLKHRANYTLAFGSMVWPHALCKVMLYEQIYRAYMILSGSSYHHE
jgi:23S rRNA (pseudouridine1915-N3)-methyltransferase